MKMCDVDRSRQNTLRKISSMVVIALLSAQGRCIHIGEPKLGFMPSKESLLNRTSISANISEEVGTKSLSVQIEKNSYNNSGNNVSMKPPDFVSKIDTGSASDNTTEETKWLENILLSFTKLKPNKTASELKTPKFKVDLQVNSPKNESYSIGKDERIKPTGLPSTTRANLEKINIQDVIDVKNTIIGDEKLEQTNKESVKKLLNESLNLIGSPPNSSKEEKRMHITDPKSQSDQKLNAVTENNEYRRSVKRFLEASVSGKSIGRNLNISSESHEHKIDDIKSFEEKLKKRIAISTNGTNMRRQDSTNLFQSRDSGLENPSLDFQNFYIQQFKPLESSKQQETSNESSKLSGTQREQDLPLEFQNYYVQQKPLPGSGQYHKQQIKSEEMSSNQNLSLEFGNFLKERLGSPGSMYQPSPSLEFQNYYNQQFGLEDGLKLQENSLESSGDISSKQNTGSKQLTFSKFQEYSTLKDSVPKSSESYYQQVNVNFNKSQDSKQSDLSKDYLEYMQHLGSSHKSKEEVTIQAFTSKSTNPLTIKEEYQPLEFQKNSIQSVESLQAEENTGKQNVSPQSNVYVKIINETIEQEFIEDVNINNEFTQLIYNFFKNKPSAQISDETFDDIIDKLIALKNANKVRSSGRKIRVPEKIALNQMLLELRQLIHKEDESLVKYNWLSSGVNVQDGLHSIIKLCDSTEITVIDEKLLLFVERLLEEARERLPKVLRVKQLEETCSYFKEIRKRVGPLHTAMDELATQEEIEPKDMFEFLKKNYLMSPSTGQLMTILLHSASNRIIEQIDIKFREARVNNKLKAIIHGEKEKTEKKQDVEKDDDESYVNIRKTYGDLLEDIVLVYTILAEFIKHQGP